VALQDLTPDVPRDAPRDAPRSGTKRGITGASEMAKPWLRCVSYFIACSFVILNVIVLSTLALYYGYKLVLLVLRF